MFTKTNYRSLEKKYFTELEKASVNLHPYITRAFEPYIFNNSGFSNFSNFSHLKFLTNSQHNGRSDSYMKEHSWGVFTGEEFEILCKLFDVSAEINLQLDGRKTPSVDSIFAALLAVRLIEKNKKGSTVLEIGPGSGFVTAMLALKGYKVITIDVLPSFIFYQNMFFRHLFGNNFKYDFAFDRNKIGQFSVLQLSWWNFINVKNKLINIDAISINHSLNEVSKMAMHYYLKLCEKQNKSFGVFIENVGFTSGNNNFNNFFRDSSKYKIIHQNFHGEDTYNEKYLRGSFIQFEENISVPDKLDDLVSVSKNRNQFKIVSFLIVQNLKKIFFLSFLKQTFIYFTTKLRILIRKTLNVLGLSIILRPYFYFKSKLIKNDISVNSDSDVNNLDPDYLYDNFKFSHSYIDVDKYLHTNFNMHRQDSWETYSAIYDWDPTKHHFNDK